MTALEKGRREGRDKDIPNFERYHVRCSAGDPSSSLKDDKDARACRPQMHLITHCLVLRFLGERDRGEGRKEGSLKEGGELPESARGRGP